jgi:N-acetylglucosaminyldiphosphoundecaprenol N-acetyl-beta-D-mannosaminyltransferase
MFGLASEAIRRGWSVYLLGGANGVADKAAEQLTKVLPDLTVAGTHHGHLVTLEQSRMVIKDINESGATVLLIGMGQPRQEEWVVANKQWLNPLVIWCCGGYLDKLTNRIDSYPQWVHRLYLYWLYRLVKEPRRLGRRYTIGMVKFSVRVLLARRNC